MNKKDYKKDIIECLLKKYNNRKAKQVDTKRRIIVKPSEIYAKYANNDADIEIKQMIHDAVDYLVEANVIHVDYLQFSIDIKRICLLEESADRMQEILKKEYGILPRKDIINQIKVLLEDYRDCEKPVADYCQAIHKQVEDPRCSLDIASISANLKMLRFLTENETDLYIREASMLVYGDSKWFEQNNLEGICNLLRDSLNIPREEGERNDTILGCYMVNPAEQEIFIKGDWIIDWGKYILETKTLNGGIAIASKDISSIRKITVRSLKVMTIENKTSYQRMEISDMAMFYLGGYATRYQIQFLQKVKEDNPSAEYYHFGDIDIGGFWIHKHLCRMSSVEFKLYAMGIKQLQDSRFASCLRPLTDSDLRRLELLLSEKAYHEILQYMKEHHVKLEQEIISFYLMKDRSD